MKMQVKEIADIMLERELAAEAMTVVREPEAEAILRTQTQTMSAAVVALETLTQRESVESSWRWTRRWSW